MKKERRIDREGEEREEERRKGSRGGAGKDVGQPCASVFFPPMILLWTLHYCWINSLTG